MKDLVLKDTSTLKEAVRKLDANGNGFLAIVDQNNKLIGILTDGDIRRGFLKGSKELMEVINFTPETMDEHSKKDEIIHKLRESHKKHMPLVNQSGILIDVFILDDERFNIKPNWVVIMAGGMGTRLGELTRDMPKPMLPLGGKPMIERIIELFKSSGYKKFMISVNCKSKVIKKYFGNGKKFGIDVVYLEEKDRLGTAGALSLIDTRLITETFFVVNGDVITSLDYDEMLKFHKSNNSDATMCVKENSYQIPYGVIQTNEDNSIVAIEEKPTNYYYINTGIYTLEPGVIDILGKNCYSEMTDLFGTLSNNKKIIKSFKLEGHWLDLGMPNDYYSAKSQFDSL